MVITFAGAAGTGKSTLVERLLDMPQFSEYTRYSNPQRALHNFLGDKFPHSSKANTISQAGIYSCFILDLLKNKNIICDRSIIDIFAYSELSKGVDDFKVLEDIFSKGIELHDVIFYVPIEFQVENDGFRDTNTEYIKKTDETIQKYMDKYKDKVKIVEVRGSVDDRLNIILETLKEL